MASQRRKPRGSSGRSRRSSIEGLAFPEEDRGLLERFIERLRSVPEVQAVVLFGSFARGDIDRRSDIDLLLVTDIPDPGSLRPRIARLIGELRPHREISPTLTNLRDIDPSFLRTVFTEGVVLHGKMVLAPTQLALLPRVLIAYDLTGVSPTRKVHISRLIHGFRSVKTVAGKRRTYEYPGLKAKYGGVSLSRSALMLKSENAKEFIKQLEKRHVPYTRWDVYL